MKVKHSPEGMVQGLCYGVPGFATGCPGLTERFCTTSCSASARRGEDCTRDALARPGLCQMRLRVGWYWSQCVDAGEPLRRLQYHCTRAMWY
eukprot:3773301-Rhodomonas_salina.1